MTAIRLAASEGDVAETVATGRRSDIQGLRAVAVLMVVAFHAGLPLPGGFVGVDVFFVVSGFVITGLLRREWSQSGRIRLGHFYLKRFWRLFPALALMVTFTVLVSALVLSPLGSQQIVATTAVAAMLMSANIVIASTVGGYFSPPAESNPLLNTWSLSVEEQFYVVFPALIMLGWYLSRRYGPLRHSPQVIIGALAVTSFALAVLGSNGHALPGTVTVLGFYSPATRAWEFAVGALLALTLAKWTPRQSFLLTVSGILGLVLLGASIWLINDATSFPGTWTLVPVVGTLLLLLSGTRGNSATARALSTRPLVQIGDWSYSIYLWHWPLIVFAVYLWPQNEIVAPLAALVSLVPALVSFRLVEQPLRTMGALSQQRTTFLIVIVLTIPITLAASMNLIANNFWLPRYASGQMSQLQGDIGHDKFHGDVQGRFFPCTPQQIRDHAPYWEDFLRCQQSHPSGPVEVALVGDSHAEHLFLGLAEQFPRTNIAYYIGNELPIRSAGEDMSRIIDFAARNPSIRTIVVSAWWRGRGVPIEELSATLRQFQEAGKLVFVTDDVPDFPFDAIQCRDRRALIMSSNLCEQDAAAFRTLDATYREALGEVVDRVPGVELLGTSQFFCSATLCSMRNGDMILYRDPGHLNLNGTRFLAQYLAADKDFADAMTVR